MSSLSKEHNDAVAVVFKSTSALVMRHLQGWDFALGQDQFARLKSMLQKMATDLGSGAFILEITQQDDSQGKSLSASEILTANSTGLKSLKLGRSLRIIGMDEINSTGAEGSPDRVELTDASENTVLVWGAEDGSATVFANGRTVDYFDVKSPNSRPAAASRHNRKAEEYEMSVLDHYETCVRHADRTDHWSHRKTRKLRKRLGSAHKTELIFHRDLHHWLKTHLDGQVYSKPRDTSQDELDIFISSPRGRCYLIELKWMGTSWEPSENEFSYNIKAVADGLEQLRDYLDKQPRIKRGSLVAYDGRTQADFEALQCMDGLGPEGCKRLSSCEGVPVHPRGNCIVLFLESKTASE